MNSKKLIAVVGATGAQGGGLVRAILDDKNDEFVVRAITRNRNSDKAKELANLGAEVVEANVDDKESLKKAFNGAYGVFCITFFWEHFSPEKENENARAMAEAAAEVGVKHVVWSTLEDSREWVPLNDDRMPTLMGKYKVPHFDAKGESNEYFVKSGVPYTLLLTSFYWDNFIHFGMGPQKGPDGNAGITFPMGDSKLPGIAAKDIGKCALGIFKAGDKYQGEKVAISGENLTGQQLAKGFSDLLGTEVGYNAVPPEAYRGFGFPGAEDLGNMFQFKRDFEEYYSGIRSVEFSKTLNPELLSFKEWLEENRDSIEIK